MWDTILIIDDSDKLREQIVRIITDVALFDRILEAQDGIDGLKIVLNEHVDLIICDLEMPRMDGFRFISTLQSREELRDIPVIMLTGREDRDMKIKGLEQGASDYVTKPFDAGELVARVKVQLKIKGLQDDLRRTNEKLLEISNTDPLTGLYNRRYLMEILDKEFQRARRKKWTLSMIMLDIDHFKSVNDTYGHQNGDLVLVEVAKQLQYELRSYNVAARYGGEEFVILMPESSQSETLFVAEKIRTSVQGIAFAKEMNGLIITVSLGVALFPAAKVDCIDSLIRQADEALYRAKHNGRNRVEFMN
jgi:diguanylate cyclase (GGDEF)-like protein